LLFFAIFRTHQKLISFLFMPFRTLSQKPGGYRISNKMFFSDPEFIGIHISQRKGERHRLSLQGPKMKLAIVKPAVLSIRCTHRSASGRQCRLAISDAQSGLCANHHAELKQKERADVAGILFQYAQDFQTAQGINHSLRSLYWLVGKNRISSRRATVLAYISNLLLRTLPAIAAERKSGIRYCPAQPDPDPTKKPS
jgi:hypothetical protein